MPKPILYQLPYSAPVRSVNLVASEIGIELDKKELNLMEGKHKTQEFLEINPQHTIPTLDDNGYILWESNAICTYLIDKYAKNDQLYPKDLEIRSTINQRLFFNAAIIFPALRNSLVSIFFLGQTELTESQVNAFHNAYKLLNVLFRDNKYLVGNSVTVADFCTISGVTQADCVHKIDDQEYPNIRPWLKRMAAIPSVDELNTKRMDEFKIILKEKLEKNKVEPFMGDPAKRWIF